MATKKFKEFIEELNPIVNQAGSYLVGYRVIDDEEIKIPLSSLALSELLDNRYLRRDINDHTEYNLSVYGDFRVGSSAGSVLYDPSLYGWYTDRNGNFVMSSLRLRNSLEVPELRYNRVTTVGSELWVTEGAIFETVTAISSTKYKVKLKLQSGEKVPFVKGDLLKGYYHNFGSGLDNQIDPEIGTTLYGFWLICLIVDYVDLANGEIDVILQHTGDATNSLSKPPVANLTVARVGWYIDKTNTDNYITTVGPITGQTIYLYKDQYGDYTIDESFIASRLRSILITSKDGYMRILTGIDSFNYTPEQYNLKIAMLLGDLSKLSVPFVNPITSMTEWVALNGYSAYLKNVYMTGRLFQLGGDSLEHPITVYRGDYSATTGYYIGEQVTYNQALYTCIKDHNQDTDTTENRAPDKTDSLYWVLITISGNDGKPGLTLRPRGRITDFPKIDPEENKFWYGTDTNGDSWMDWVISSNGLYIWLRTDTGTTVGEGKYVTDLPNDNDPTSTIGWVLTNYMQPIATSVILSDNGYIDMLGSSYIAITKDISGTATKVIVLDGNDATIKVGVPTIDGSDLVYPINLVGNGTSNFGGLKIAANGDLYAGNPLDPNFSINVNGDVFFKGSVYLQNTNNTQTSVNLGDLFIVEYVAGEVVGLISKVRFGSRGGVSAFVTSGLPSDASFLTSSEMWSLLSVSDNTKKIHKSHLPTLVSTDISDFTTAVQTIVQNM